MRIYGDYLSGNCYKIKLLCHLLSIKYEWQHVDILKHETHTAEFLALNPNGKIPTVVFADNKILCESNAIINYLARNTEFYPSDPWVQAQIQQWQFFEQYSHEPFIAVARYIKRYLGLPEERAAEFAQKKNGGYRALQVMESQLKKADFLTGDSCTTADIALYAYTHVAHEGEFSLDNYPHIQRWLGAIESLPNYTAMES